MLIDAARRAEAAAREMLAVVNGGSASCVELREALGVCRSLSAAASAFQVKAAAVIARAERHGDGGTQVLADTAGLSQGEARSQVKTAEALRAAPAVSEALEAGAVSRANARRLADAIAKSSADAVASDAELLSKAETQRPEQFAREVRRWVVERDGDDGTAEHARQRARRYVKLWDSDDGMVCLRGEFDMITGRRIGNRLRAEAARLYDSDKKAARAAPDRLSQNGQADAVADSGSGRRSFDQCMADVLDSLTSLTTSADGADRTEPYADICVVAHLDTESAELVAQTPDGHKLPKAVLEELACNAKFTGVLYGSEGSPIWRAKSLRRASDPQRQILFARYGGCFHCGAHPGLCQIHHIKPVSEGGATSVKNMVPVCWSCHNLIHHHDWRIKRHPQGDHTLHPPERIRYGPAHADERPPPLCGSDVGERASLVTPRPGRPPPELGVPGREPEPTRLPAPDLFNWAGRGK